MSNSMQSIRSQSLGELLKRSAKRFPEKLAIVCGETQWSYQEFDKLCNQIAHGLMARGVSFGEKITILSRNSHAFAVMRYALARLGAILVPINFMLNAEEVAFILRHSGARLLLVDSEHANLGIAAARDTQVTAFIGLPSETSAETAPGMPSFFALISADTSYPEVAVTGEDVLQIIYTSGTESSPKGALLTHGAVIWEYVTCIVDAEISERDVLLHALPLYHCAQLDAFLGPAIYVGAVNIITANPTANNLLSLMATHGISSFFAPPTVWISLLRSPQFERTDLAALQKGYYGASIMPVAILREIFTRLPKLRLWNLYGQTEIAPVATVLKPEDQIRKAGSAGKPGLNVETRVIDDSGNDVRVGQIGEIVHRSPHLMAGYYNDREKTAAAFAGGWFHSGDLATVDEEGYITVVDRKKDMIKSGGENVSSREVEEAIYKLDSVSEVAVIGLPDEKWIEAVTAIIVVKDGHSLAPETVLQHCNELLAKFKAPKVVHLVASLPKNPSGKVLKRDLRVLFSAL